MLYCQKRWGSTAGKTVATRGKGSFYVESTGGGEGWAVQQYGDNSRTILCIYEYVENTLKLVYDATAMDEVSN